MRKFKCPKGTCRCNHDECCCFCDFQSACNADCPLLHTWKELPQPEGCHLFKAKKGETRKSTNL